MFRIELRTRRRNGLENDRGEAGGLTGIGAEDVADDACIARSSTGLERRRSWDHRYEQYETA